VDQLTEDALKQEALHPRTTLRRLQELAERFPSEVLQSLDRYAPSKRTAKWEALYKTARQKQFQQATLAALKLTDAKACRLWVHDCMQEALNVCAPLPKRDERLVRVLRLMKRSALPYALFRARCLVIDVKRDLLLSSKFSPPRGDYTDPTTEKLVALFNVLDALLLVTGSPDVLSNAQYRHQLSKALVLTATAIAQCEAVAGLGEQKTLWSEVHTLQSARLLDVQERQALLLTKRLHRKPPTLAALTVMFRQKFAQEKTLDQEQTEKRILSRIKQGAPKSIRQYLPNPSEALDFDKALDPNTPPSQLAKLVDEFPERVAKNPVLPLLALEEPLLAQEVYKKIRYHQHCEDLEAQVMNLSPNQLMLWACFCAGRAAQWVRLETRLTQVIYYLRAFLQHLFGMDVKDKIRRLWFETTEMLERIKLYPISDQDPEKQLAAVMSAIHLGPEIQLKPRDVIACMKSALHAALKPETEILWQRSFLFYFSTKEIPPHGNIPFKVVKSLIEEISGCYTLRTYRPRPFKIVLNTSKQPQEPTLSDPAQAT
jgi:hypothetical protein